MGFDLNSKVFHGGYGQGVERGASFIPNPSRRPPRRWLAALLLLAVLVTGAILVVLVVR